MASAKEFQKRALVMGILSSCENRHEELISVLTEKFGPLVIQSPVMDFPYTDYYDSEMGSHPVRYLLMFRELVDPSTLADIKTLTNSLEKCFVSETGGRTVNIDPGLLSLSGFILATCKERSHRIPLKDGIYAETTLIYQGGAFIRLPWSYADYSSDEIRSVLRDFREKYKKILKNL